MKTRHRTERCAKRGEVEKIGMQLPEKPASTNDFIGHWLYGHLESFWLAFSLFWVNLARFWVVLGHYGSLCFVLGRYGSFWLILGHFS